MRSMRVLAFFGYLPTPNDQYTTARIWGRVFFNIFLHILLIPSASIGILVVLILLRDLQMYKNKRTVRHTKILNFGYFQLFSLHFGHIKKLL